MRRADPSSRPVELLLVEDSGGDVRLTAEALRSSAVVNQLHHASDGVDALHFLRREGPYVDAPRPDLILLDLNLPRKDGREVLAEVKGDPALRSIPVVILTTSQADEDVRRGYGLQGNCYIVKPLALDEFMDVIKSIESFWFGVATLPPTRP